MLCMHSKPKRRFGFQTCQTQLPLSLPSRCRWSYNIGWSYTFGVPGPFSFFSQSFILQFPGHSMRKTQLANLGRDTQMCSNAIIIYCDSSAFLILRQALWLPSRSSRCFFCPFHYEGDRKLPKRWRQSGNHGRCGNQVKLYFNGVVIVKDILSLT